MQLETDTIVAISTPPGRGGIGIVRLSGPMARAIVEAVCRLRRPLAPGRARLAEIVDDAGEVLDEAVVTWFAAPHSYTTEDVVEIAAHGAPVLLDYLVRAAMARGARLAEPGEFTQRAFLAGRLDLTQAEAVHDLVAAQTLQQARLAAAQLGGSVAKAVGPVKRELVSLMAELEAGIDFAEDDLELLPQAEIGLRLDGIRGRLHALAATYEYGRIVRDGFTLAIVGRPNAGKSSLFNRLLERDRAIVTAQPGTTRDPIAERVSLDGVPVELIDTAGLRDAPGGPEGEAETQGILRSRMAMAEADVVLHVVDAAAAETGVGTWAGEMHPEDAATAAALAGRAHLVVVNKADLVEDRSVSGALYTSALTGEGIAELRRAILTALTGGAPAADAALLTNLRQHQAIAASLDALGRASGAVAIMVPHEMLLLDLQEALEGLDRLTGVTTTDDILNLIFSSFCIGK